MTADAASSCNSMRGQGPSPDARTSRGNRLLALFCGGMLFLLLCNKLLLSQSSVCLTRAGLACMMRAALQKHSMTGGQEQAYQVSNPFSDVSIQVWNSIASREVLAALGAYPDGTFRPMEPVFWPEMTQYLSAVFCRPDNPYVEPDRLAQIFQRLWLKNQGDDRPVPVTAAKDLMEHLAKHMSDVRVDLGKTGMIIDARTEKPVPNAYILSACGSTRSSSDGSFLLEGRFRKSLQNIFIAAQGYKALRIKKNLAKKTPWTVRLVPILGKLVLEMQIPPAVSPESLVVRLNGKQVSPIPANGIFEISGAREGYYQLEVTGKGIKTHRSLMYLGNRVLRNRILLQSSAEG